MEENIKVSVVMPVHNVEKYLREALDDVCAQTLREIEIICVNDGSTDGSESIIREYMEKDARISLISQEQSYAGVARNRGIDAAKGAYIICWDADDRFHENALERLYERIVADDADLCVCNAQRYNTLTQKYVPADSYFVREFLPQELPFSVKTWPKYIFNFATNVPWNKLYRRAFIQKHGLRYEARERANDVYFNMMARYLAEKITVVDEVLVAYRVNNSDSLTGTLSRTPMIAIDAFLKVHEDLDKLGAFEDEQVRQSFANRALYSILFALHRQTDGASFVAIYEYLKNGGLEKLEITDQGEGYYYKERVYELLKRIHRCSVVDYIMIRDAELMEQQKERMEKYLQERIRQKDEVIARRDKRIHDIVNSNGYQMLLKLWAIENKLKGKKRQETEE
ncbi:MAG: glycosyltransferase [Eubacteriales bacterium]|nr:glycosyltransferase [Eubacteriales bacterium]